LNVTNETEARRSKLAPKARPHKLTPALPKDPPRESSAPDDPVPPPVCIVSPAPAQASVKVLKGETVERKWFFWQDFSAAALSALVNALAILLMAFFTLAGNQIIGEVTIVMSPSSDEAGLDELVINDEPQIDLIPAELDVTQLEAPLLQLAPETDSADRISRLFGTKTEAAPFPVGQVDASILDGRSGDRKAELLEEFGGTPATEQAVNDALKWLAEHQAEDGSWSFDHKAKLRPKKCNCPASGTVRDCRNGATAMALLPFLGAGHTHLKGPYQQTVEKGLYYLMSELRLEDDDRGNLAQGGGNMYAHGIAAITLCEAYAMTQDRGLKQPAQWAINHTVYAQADDGGWRYSPKQPGDTSAVGWQLMALKSGQMGYLDVPDETFTRAGRFLDGVSSQQGAVYGYNTPGEGHGTTAVGLLSRMYTGWNKDHPPLRAGARQLSNWGPSKSSMYYNYYATQVMRHLNDPEDWPKWNVAMRTYLVESQDRNEKKHSFGSWHFRFDDFGYQGGRLYHTSLATMTLEVYYRHLPLYRKDATASQ
jgi:hypothetical protein